MATGREQLADLLRQARIEAGYGSHGALARKLNVSRPVITKAENANGWRNSSRPASNARP